MNTRSTKQFVNFLLENIRRTEKLILNESQDKKTVYVIRTNGFVAMPVGVYTSEKEAKQAIQDDDNFDGTEGVQEETIQATKIEDFNSDDLGEKKEQYLEHLEKEMPYYVLLSDDGILVFNNVKQAYKYGLDNIYGPDWSVYPMKENEYTNPFA